MLSGAASLSVSSDEKQPDELLSEDGGVTAADASPKKAKTKKAPNAEPGEPNEPEEPIDPGSDAAPLPLSCPTP